ncbi:MAG TPA: Hsp20/alpha crystallin family protein [Anaerolineales bacterium]|nr:Hsp20/alpha crystallin family protein [Anaerolineales bacterium]
MAMIIRKTFPALLDTRREVFAAAVWQVRSNVWSPPTDIYETEENLVVKMEIAGTREEDLEVALQKNLLLVNGSRSDTSEERRAYHQMEIPFGKFSTAIELPLPVDVEQAHAEYKDGFLTIILPKAKPKQIEVE